MGRIPIRHNLPAVAYYGAEHILVQTDTIPIRTLLQNRSCQFPSYEIWYMIYDIYFRRQADNTCLLCFIRRIWFQAAATTTPWNNRPAQWQGSVRLLYYKYSVHNCERKKVRVIFDKFFKMDNPLWEAMGRLFDIFVLNVLWLVCCLPVFTIGPSTTAVFYAMIDRKSVV